MAVILAAGLGTRMKSSLPKVLHPISGLPMVGHVLRAVNACRVSEKVTIVGKGADLVKHELADQCQFVIQDQQLGTGHAVLQAKGLLQNKPGNTLVVCGDTPLLKGSTLNDLFTYHETSQSKATILTAEIDDPKGYGRVIRDQNGGVIRIVEEKDAKDSERLVREINTGTYIFDNQALFQALEQVGNDNAQGEYYLPDVISILTNQSEKVSAYVMEDVSESLGVNDRLALSKAQLLMNRRLVEDHMRQGVTFTNPDSVYLEVDVTIGSDTVVEAGVQLKGKTSIGKGCLIGAHSEIDCCVIKEGVQIRQSFLEHSQIAKQVTIGPFAHLRPHSNLGEGVHIGNFVEVKNATLHAETKAGHLAYIGDAELGESVNVGCGVIFCNYDGKKKRHSKIGDQVFIGSNSNIVSPVVVGDRSVIAAGSTITEDIDSESLGIARSRQVNKADYWHKFNTNK